MPQPDRAPASTGQPLRWQHYRCGDSAVFRPHGDGLISWLFGSTLSLAGGNLPTFCGSLRNAAAIARAAQRIGQRTLVVAAGERWPDGTMRPAIEDWIGAGAIVHYMQGTCSPEAKSAQAAFLNAKDALTGILRQCSSGRELIERGFGIDIEYAAALNTSEAVPLLRDGYYSDHRPSSSVD